ncbi:hypothetical protein ACIP9H_15070 [Streptomyces sp. NPDC088732]|uniref:hypothetical protein n=1 Tax=Streptomyces sp. NPDC088732 TaxID=3365879 RepID=UPI00381E8E5C
MSRPSVSEVSAFVADLVAYRKFGAGDLSELMSRKADLLERIAAESPGDPAKAEIAAEARAYADRLRGE